MTTDSEASPIDLLAEARTKGMLIHDLEPKVTEMLAAHPNEKLRLHTTTEPRKPKTYAEFREDRKRERAYDAIANNTYDRLTAETVYGGLRQLPGFEEAVENQQLGEYLADTFRPITKIKADNIHTENPHISKNGRPDGIVMAERMTFTVASSEQSDRLHGILQALLVTTKKGPHIINQGTYHEGDSASYTVTIKNINEHTIRAIARVIEAISTKDKNHAHEEEVKKAEGSDKNIKRVILPPHKHSFKATIKAGETFPPEDHAAYVAADEAYQRLELEATYTKPEHYPEITKWPSLLITDAAPALQGMRDLLRPHISMLRGDNEHNLEQHPDKDSRLLIEDGIELRRDFDDDKDTNQMPLEEAEAIEYESPLGPPKPRVARLTERAAASGREIMSQARRAPTTAAKRATEMIPTGFLDVGVKLIPFLFPVGEAGGNAAKDVIEYIRRRKEAIAAGSRLDRVLYADPTFRAKMEKALPEGPTS